MKSLDEHFSKTFGDLTVQNTLLRAQNEQLSEQLQAVSDELTKLKSEAKPVETPADELAPRRKGKNSPDPQAP